MKNNEIAVGILGVGSYLPEKIMTNKEFEKTVDTTDAWIVERTGIRERRMAPENVATSDMASWAAEKALKNAGVDASEIDLIIAATVTPDMFFPSVACLVQENIKANRAGAFDLSAACTGFVYGLAVASQFIKTGVYQKILVIGAETFSKFIDFTDRNTCVLFGDGAGAAVVGRAASGQGIMSFDFGSDGSGGDLLKLPAGGSRCPATIETVNGRQHFLSMSGSGVFKFAVKIMGETALKSIEEAGMTASDIDWFVPHQANIRIIQSAAKRMTIPMDKVIVNVDRYANTSAATIPIALDEAVTDGKIKRGDKLVLVGFGAGLTWGSCVLEW